MRESTSRNQANGSTPLRLQEAMKVRSTAAVLPPWSLPKNAHAVLGIVFIRRVVPSRPCIAICERSKLHVITLFFEVDDMIRECACQPIRPNVGRLLIQKVGL